MIYLGDLNWGVLGWLDAAVRGIYRANWAVGFVFSGWLGLE